MPRSVGTVLRGRTSLSSVSLGLERGTTICAFSQLASTSMEVDKVTSQHPMCKVLGMKSGGETNLCLVMKSTEGPRSITSSAYMRLYLRRRRDCLRTKLMLTDTPTPILFRRVSTIL